jgi:hypothetical protein
LFFLSVRFSLFPIPTFIFLLLYFPYLYLSFLFLLCFFISFILTFFLSLKLAAAQRVQFIHVFISCR